MHRSLFAVPFVVLASCSSTQRVETASAAEPIVETVIAPARGGDATRFDLRASGVEMMYRSDIDRLTRFRAPGGPEMLFTQLLEEPALPDEAYTFYGGAYSWTAPQNGDLGWVGPDGAPRAWPPDPAMNIGPARVTLAGDAVTSETPVSRLGLIERKTFTPVENGAEVAFTLENTLDRPVTAGTWINTAVYDDALVAVRLVGPDALASIRGWDRQAIDRFISILDRQGNGWAIVKINEAAWTGGIKVYVPRTVGELPTIAVWRDGQWLVRTQRVTEAATQTVGRLTTLGEGSIAMYIQPGDDGNPWIIEAELYGPIVDIPAGGSHDASESWRLIASPDGPDTSLLPVTPDPASAR
ncbi:MAG: hypothetical protein AAGH64_11390 [Planctomycetota bacterium]